MGVIELNKKNTIFRPLTRGFSSYLEETSAFRIMEFDVPEVGRSGYAVIFRRFTRPDLTEEYLAGWVKPEYKQIAEGWVRIMNDHIAKMLELEQG